MPRWYFMAFDVVAVTILVVCTYFPRYRRRDLLVSYVAVNLGVMAVVVALTSSTVDVGVGVGFGLFGVLSIVRLRSAELAQQEVAYYFAALALGLLGGISVTPDWLAPSLMFVIVAGMTLIDHPRLFARNRHQLMTLDRAFTDERDLVGHLGALLAADIRHIEVLRVDLVNDLTVVDVRYRLRHDPYPPAEAHPDAPIEHEQIR